MLQIYDAIELVDIISEKSGHTKPWVIRANTPQGLRTFVVKLYTTEQVDRYHCLTNEVICNLLANEFELKVPTCALINIPLSLAHQLPHDALIQYENADPRPKFATLLIDNVNNAIPTLPKSLFKKRIPLDTLYAFDNLIRNRDRGFEKTNLLIGPEHAILIDHELAFLEQDILNIDINNLQLADKYTKHHLFFQHLKRTKRKNRQDFFNDFHQYLIMLNINRLNPYFTQLRQEGFNDYSAPILNWITNVKQNSTIFVDKLKGSLQ